MPRAAASSRSYPSAALIVAAAALLVVTLFAVLGGCRAPRAAPEGFFGGGGPVVQYFRMDGCPHCERFDRVWGELKGAGGGGVEFQEFDAQSEEARQNGVRAFPHIQMVVDGEATVYEGSRDVQSLERFIQSRGG